MRDYKKLDKMIGTSSVTPLGKALLRRNVKDIKGYMDWAALVTPFDKMRWFSYCMKALTLEGYSLEDEKTPESIKDRIKHISKLTSHTPYFLADNVTFPIIYVEKQMVTGMLKTDVSKSICQSIKQIYPNMMIMIPKGTCVVDGADIGALYLQYQQASTVQYAYPIVQPPEYEKNTLCSEYPFENVSLRNDRTKLMLTAFVRNSDQYIMGCICLEPDKSDFLELPHNTHNKLLAEALRAIAIQTYLILEHHPQMTSEATYVPQNKQEARQCRIRPVEPTRWLGKGFTTVGEKNSNGAGEFGVKQTMHWRRGHWRQQPYGKNNGQTKTIWIQPYLAGSLEKSAVLAA